MLHTGSLLAGHRIERVLGRGGMGVVYLATQLSLERPVALKVIAPELAEEPGFRARFQREARLAASIDHPNVIPVYEAGAQGSALYLTMRFVDGTDLNALIRRGGRLDPAHAAHVVSQVGAALDAAHARGLVHRDVKPQNVLLCGPRGREHAYLTDFGLVKRSASVGSLTRTGGWVGTIDYIAPEQLRGEPVDGRADVYSLGCVLFEALTGRAPFLREREVATLWAHIADPPPVASELAPDVPEELDGVIRRALAKSPDERYASAGELGSATLASSGDGPASIATRVPTARPAQPAPPLSAPEAANHRRTVWRRLIAAATGLAAAVVIAVLITWEREATDAPAAPPPSWPSTMSLGLVDTVDGPAGVTRRVGRGGSTFACFAGDAVARTDWSHDPKRSPAQFAADAQRHGLVPHACYYGIRALGRKGKEDANREQIRQTLLERRLMRIYWRNVRQFLRSLGSTDAPVAVSYEPSVFSLLERQLDNASASPDSVPAVVGGSGVRELRGLPDNLVGFARGWEELRDRHAPKALLGYFLNDYAAGIDIARTRPPRPTVVAAGGRSASFSLDLKGAYDFATMEVNWHEAGKEPAQSKVYSIEEKEAMVDFVRAFVREADTPVVLLGVPLGNTASRAITDRPYHWHDSWVQWLMGTNDFAGLRKLRDAGVIGVSFGVSSGKDATCACDAAHDGVTNGGNHGSPSTSADDDGGYFAERAAVLRRTGGLHLSE